MQPWVILLIVLAIFIVFFIFQNGSCSSRNRDHYRVDFERRNAKLTTGNDSPECAYGIDDGKPCNVSNLDRLDGTVTPYVSLCSGPGWCYRGSCMNFASDAFFG